MGRSSRTVKQPWGQSRCETLLSPLLTELSTQRSVSFGCSPTLLFPLSDLQIISQLIEKLPSRNHGNHRLWTHTSLYKAAKWNWQNNMLGFSIVKLNVRMCFFMGTSAWAGRVITIPNVAQMDRPSAPVGRPELLLSVRANNNISKTIRSASSFCASVW